MAKKHPNAAKKVTHRQQKKPDWKKSWLHRLRRYRGVGIMLATVVAFVLLGRGYLAVTADERDISIIGEGTPVVVQIYDQNCSTCRELDENLQQARKSFSDDDVRFLVLNINGSQGSRFAERYGAGRTTLLMFDSAGFLVNQVVGPEPSDAIEGEVRRLIARRS